MNDVTAPSLLTEAHYQMIMNGLQHIKHARRHVAQAKSANIDVSQHEKDLADSEAKLLALKNSYFPNR
jgi:hypothetical protein